jgi:hypothetical protein
MFLSLKIDVMEALDAIGYRRVPTTESVKNKETLIRYMTVFRTHINLDNGSFVLKVYRMCWLPVPGIINPD